ncbi:MAG TPA: hypothetical protein VIZ31_10665 [Vicinamibacteria bacterium]
MHVRVCVDCGEEFRPGVTRCSDCGGALQDHYEGEGQEAGAPPGQATTGTRPFVFARDVRNLVPVAEALRVAGIPTQITQGEPTPEERQPGFLLGVRDGDRLAAMAVVEPLLASVPGFDLLETREAPEGGAAVACPACDTPVPEGVTECPDCGLLFGGEPRE